MAERGAEREGGRQIDADDDGGVGCETQLAGAAKDDIPRLPAGVRQRLVRAVGTTLAFRTALTFGAGPVQPGTGAAVSRPAAEVPFGAGLQSFFSSSSSSGGPR